ncbi:Hypothetical protein DHA2_150947 [Giardia duodenalis]|uniref:Uncharacterized protein n=1 Tax=Giardia intestinalis TaxID=5741 RepID=V6TKG8_GIAIN|nr:Hypothetical protein DHA2_150947 [Giardia intestinalis]
MKFATSSFILLVFGLLHSLAGSTHCFYPNESILIYGRNSTAELRLWPLQSNQSPVCASLKGGGTLLLESLYYTISTEFPPVPMNQPIVLTFACTDSNYCESIVRNANSFSYKLSSGVSTNQGVVDGSIKSLQRHNFVYHECWSNPILLYTDSSIRPIYGLCISVTPTPCRAPADSLQQVTAEIRLVINGTSYNLPVVSSSEGSGGFSLPFDHMNTKYYCHTCPAQTSGEALDLCKRVAGLVRETINFEATLVVNIPYTNTHTGILAPLRYTTDVPIKGSVYYFNCFKDPLVVILWDRISVSLQQNEAASNCVLPPNTETVYFTMTLIITNNSGGTSELYFRHKVGNFVWTTDRYWFLCRDNQTCLSLVHNAYSNGYEASGYLIIEFHDADDSYVDDLTLWLSPRYNCFKLVDLFATKSDIRIVVQTQFNYCAEQYEAIIGTKTYKLHIFENLLVDMEYMRILPLGLFVQTITNWTPQDTLVFSCSTYDSTYTDNLCKDVLARVYELVRVGKIIATVHVAGYSTAIGRVYRANYIPIYITAGVAGAFIVISSSIYVFLMIRRHKAILHLIHTDAEPDVEPALTQQK